MPDEHAATFSSSDPTIDAIFELGRHSALFTAQEQFIDTPTREKGPWLWDGFNESKTAMAAFGEQNLTRKSLLEFAQSQGRYWPNGAINKIYPTGLGALDINEFTEIYPEWVWQYWMHTGDRALLAQVYPVLLNLSDYVERDRSTGRPGSSRACRSTNIYYDFPIVTRINVLGVERVPAGRRRRRARSAGPQREVTRQRDRQHALTDAINARLTRPDGTYVDGLTPNGTPGRPSRRRTPTRARSCYGVVPAATVGRGRRVRRAARDGRAAPHRERGARCARARRPGRPT